MGPLYLQINVTAERKHVTVTFSLVIHDQELFYFFIFSLLGASVMLEFFALHRPPTAGWDPTLERHAVENLQ